MMSEEPVSQFSSLSIEGHERYVLDAEFFENGTLQRIKGLNGQKMSQMWEMSRSLGKGTFGQVRQEKLKDGNGDWQYRAVKVCRRETLKQARINFTRELSALAAFSSSKHSGLFVNLMGWWSDSQNLYIAMEYVRRGDLSNYINQPLQETDAKEIITGTLNGLYVMHQEGFTHRDIKPQNILVVQKPPESQRWWVKIADFGISKRVLENDTTALHTSLGTRPYCAPEVLGYLPQPRDISVYSSKVDIWSLGCVLFNISSRGYTPFSEPELVRYCDGNVPFNPQGRRIFLGNHGLSLLQAFLLSNPEHRPSAADALHHGWFKSSVDVPNEDTSTFENSLGQSSNEPSRQRQTTQQYYNSFLQPTLPEQKEEYQRYHPEAQSQLSNSAYRNSSVPPISNQSLRGPSQDTVVGADCYTRRSLPHVDDLVTQEVERKVNSRNSGRNHLRVLHSLLDQTDRVVRKARRTLEGHNKTVNSVAFSPDGRQLASGSNDLRIKLWDLSTGEAHTLKGHTKSVLSVAFSPDGRQLASGSYDMTLKLWNVATGEAHTLEADTGWVLSLAFSLDGRLLASGGEDGTITLWDVATRETQRTIKGHVLYVFSLAFSPNGRMVASCDDMTVKLWDLATGETLCTLRNHMDWIRSVVFSPDGRIIAFESDNKTIMLWDVATGRTLRMLKGHLNRLSSLAFSPDGRMVASGSEDKTIILWDVATGEIRRKFEGHTGMVRSVVFSPDGLMVVSGSTDKTVMLWDVV